MIEVIKLILDFIGILIWPSVVLIIIFMFKNQIRSRFIDIKEVELPGGAKLKWDTKMKSLAEETGDEVKEIEKDESDPKKRDELLRQVLVEKFRSIAAQIEVTSRNQIVEASFVVEAKTQDKVLLAFASGTSLKENLKYGIYYDPAYRNHSTPFRYIGLYSDGAIVAIGEVKKIIRCYLEEDNLVGSEGDDLKTLTADENSRIKEIMANTKYYDIKNDCKFFLVDKFYKTNFEKKSDYGLRAKKYFWLDEIPGFKVGMSAEQLAKLLDGKQWE